MSYEVDVVAGRVSGLRYLAATLAAANPELGETAAILEEAADDLERLSAELRAAADAPNPLCGKRESRLGGEKCDRAVRHSGKHSWEIVRLERLAREYDAMVRSVEDARVEARAANHRARLAETDRAHLLAEREHWWNRLPGIFR